MTLLATVGMMGFGSLLMGRAAGGGPESGGLVATGIVVAGIASALLGLVAGVLAWAVSPSFAPYTATLARSLLFAFGVGITSASVVLDDALIGLFLGRAQLTRNVIFSGLKLAALGILAATVPDASGLDIVGSWIIGTVASLVAIAVILARRGKRIFHAPRVETLRRSAGTALMHHWINLATVGPRTALPLIVTGTVSAAANGAFYPAWIVATLLYIIPMHLSTSLFAVGSMNPGALARKTRVSINVAVAIGLPLSIVCAIVAHPALSLFGHAYARDATVSLQLLMLGYLPNVARFHYITVMRVEGHLRQAAIMLTGLGALEVAGAGAGAIVGGLTGLSAMFVAVMCLEAAVVARPIARVTGFTLFRT